MEPDRGIQDSEGPIDSSSEGESGGNRRGLRTEIAE